MVRSYPISYLRWLGGTGFSPITKKNMRVRALRVQRVQHQQFGSVAMASLRARVTRTAKILH